MALKSEPIYIIRPVETYCHGGQPVAYYYKHELKEVLNG